MRTVTRLAGTALCWVHLQRRCRTDPGISDGMVKIGVLTDMAGVFSDLAGQGAVTAAQMAIDDFVRKRNHRSRSNWCRPITRTSPILPPASRDSGTTLAGSI